MKSFFLFKILCFFSPITETRSLEKLTETLRCEETIWVCGKLSDSYENEILQSMGLPIQGKSLEEYRKQFEELGLVLEHLEVKREIRSFAGTEDLREWIYEQVKNEKLVEQYLACMEEKGWMDGGDGVIRIPTKQLIACLASKRSEPFHERD